MDRRLIMADVDEESGMGGLPPPSLYYPAFAMPAEQPEGGHAGGRCSECKSGDKFRDGNTGISTRKKLLFLLLVASLSLLSIVLISEQLIARHLERGSDVKGDDGDKNVVEVFNILTLEEWAKKAATEDMPVAHAAADPMHELPQPVEIVEDGVFWSSALEARVSPGPSDAAVQDELQALRSRRVTRLAEPDWIHCGRDKNRFVEFSSGGGHACARNRDGRAEFVQGEVMAFYLARLLGITNTPAVALSKVSGSQWTEVKDEMESAEWSPDAVVALIQWIPSLTKDTIPSVLREALLTSSSSSSTSSPVIGSDPRALVELAETEPDALEKLVQWSDLMLFDYLTGNYDRVASMLDGAEKERRPAVLRETVHNLGLSEETQSLWLIDNESAFLSAYSLIYGEDNKDGTRFAEFHRRLLETNCVFRRKTIQRLFALVKSPDPSQLLLRFVSDNEPLFSQLPTIHANSLFATKFPQRLSEVWQWVTRCQHDSNYERRKK